jgi:hypothetical protein
MRNAVIASFLFFVSASAFASVADEFAVKRKEIFAFVAEPKLSRQGDDIAISFTAKDSCDATIAIEDESGRIVRHLASGVLGANAPHPFAKNALAQTVLWDQKNDQGKRIIDMHGLHVRVSLGLKPVFERSLNSSPYRKQSDSAPLLQACPEGVMVYEGNVHDSLKLYDHDGVYVRTIYPFPPDKLEQVQGLDWNQFPSGMRFPLKKGTYQETLLTSGDNGMISHNTYFGVSALASRDGLIVLAKHRLNRLCIDGTTGGHRLNGPDRGDGSEPATKKWSDVPAGPVTSITLGSIFMTNTGSFNNQAVIAPSSAALSPDGKWLYLAGYSFRYFGNVDTVNAVCRMPVDGSEDAKIFAGTATSAEGFLTGAGSGPGEFNVAASVDCDASGRVYVADYMNDRVQIFSPDGKHVKDLAVAKPALVRIHRRSEEIFVFSYAVPARAQDPPYNDKPKVPVKTGLSHFGTFAAPELKAFYDLPYLPNFPFKVQDMPSGMYSSAELDSWSDELSVWIGPEAINNGWQFHGANGGRSTPYEGSGIKLLRLVDGKFTLIKDFGAEAAKSGVRSNVPIHGIQRLEVNPATGKLYLGEADSGPTIKTQKSLTEFDPQTGAMQTIQLPFNAIEYNFDLDGAIYLRSTNTIARYEFPSFREIPWDYGEEVPDLGADAPILAKLSGVQSGLRMPSVPPVCFHQGGFAVSPFGDIVASCAFRFVGISGKSEMMGADAMNRMAGGKPYTPAMYPGRESTPTTGCLQVFDKYGKWTQADAFPGMAQIDGVRMDREGNLYVMHTPARVVDGETYFNEFSSTLMKVRPGTARGFGTSKEAPIPLSAGQTPARAPDLARSEYVMWVEGADWFYGGVGYAGFNTKTIGGGCACMFARFDLDLYARSIVPEPYHFAVGVLDSNGNLIVRIGGYGNADSVGPGSLAPRGGDEVGLFHPCYVATHSDRRVFISDVANGRIVSVRLDYHATAQVTLADLPSGN